MIVRNEIFTADVCIQAEVIDLGQLTVISEEHGKEIGSRPMTADEVLLYLSLATLPATPPPAEDA